MGKGPAIRLGPNLLHWPHVVLLRAVEQAVIVKPALSESVSPDPENDGPANARRFEHTMRRVLTVSKAELDKREAAYKKSRRAKKTRATRAPK